MTTSDKTRGKRHKLKHTSFYLNIRKQFATVRVVEHWHTLSREDMEFPSLEKFKSGLNVVMGNGL